MKSEVVILSCESYEEELVYSTLKKGIALLGGWETFLKKEEKILLKPNLVRKTEVERAVITHPAVVKGIVRLLKEEGYVHLIGFALLMALMVVVMFNDIRKLIM